MAIRTLIIAGLLFLIHSCAQVGTLTGGEKDEIAPKPIEKKMNPKNGTTNFKGSQITIPFSEFVKLDNPNETIVMIPPHAKPKAKIHGKTVYLNWSEQLQENTTYTIYLNGTVKDVTEGNDSLMQLVFSTGNTIDSSFYEVKVIDAFTNEPIKNCVVGLYEGETDTIKPSYFVKTTAEGKAKLSYLKSGKYTVLAFEDKNKDLLLQADERLAFRKELLELDSNVIDSIPMRLYAPKVKERISSFAFNPPGSFSVGATASLRNADFIVNNQTLEKRDLAFIEDDSLVFLMNPGDSSSMELIVSTPSFSDTTSLTILKKEKEGKIRFTKNLSDEFLSPKDTLILSFSDRIEHIDTSLFQLINKEDSSAISKKKIRFERNKLFVLFDPKNHKSVGLTILPKGIITSLSELSDTLKIPLTIKTEEDFGSIKLDASDYTSDIIVEVLMKGKVIRSIPLQQNKIFLVNYLNPNTYTFRVILDENKNGKWDPGDRSTLTFPEILHSFSEETKVRANWEVDVKLTKKQ